MLVQIVDFNCHHFGHALGLSGSELTTIAMEHGTYDKEFMRHILLKWSHKNKNVSWREVVQALKESGQAQLAELISICYIDTTDNVPLATATESIEMTNIDMTPCGELLIITWGMTFNDKDDQYNVHGLQSTNDTLNKVSHKRFIAHTCTCTCSYMYMYMYVL